MGQRMSSDRHHAAAATAKAAPAGTTPGEICLLPEEETYLGRCWLLASSADSLSPSRWFCLSATTLQGAREKERRAFAVSSATMKEAARSRQPVLRDLGITICKGLFVCGFSTITTAAVDLRTAQLRRSLRVGGVQVELPQHLLAEEGTHVVVLTVRRVEVAMVPREYATAPYKRFPVKAPPSNEDERRMYGEGCITGILYGAIVVLHVQGCGMAAELARLCEAARRSARVPETALRVQQENAQSRVCAPAPASAAAPSSAAAAEETHRTSFAHVLTVHAAPAACEALHSDTQAASSSSILAQRVLEAVAAWAVHVHQHPHAWAPVNLFLQRYEAISESLLHAS